MREVVPKRREPLSLLDLFTDQEVFHLFEMRLLSTNPIISYSAATLFDSWSHEGFDRVATSALKQA